MDKELQKAYKMVFEDMIDSECGLLIGKYDAKNGDKKYMYGVNTVMEWIAYKVSDSVGDQFSMMFLDNMSESKRKAKSEK